MTHKPYKMGQLEQELARDVPVLQFDKDRIVTRANLLMLWVFGVLRIGERCDPGLMVGRHAYDTLTRAIAEGWLSLENPDNRHFIGGRLRAVLGKPDEEHPAVQRLLAQVFATPDARKEWEETIAGYDAYGDPFALPDEEVHYRLVLDHPDGPLLSFLVSIGQLSDGSRWIRYEAWQQNAATEGALAAARTRMMETYPHVAYVQDVRQLTPFFPAAGQNARGVPPTMQADSERSNEGEGVPDERAGSLAISEQERIQEALRAPVPVWQLDEERIVQRANLLLLWAFGALRIGERCDPSHVVGRHAYETLARAIEERRLAPEDPTNKEYILSRLRAVLGKPDEEHPAVQRFLKQVYATPGARARWKEDLSLAGALGDPFALDHIHYPLVIRDASGRELHLLDDLERLDDGGRLISYRHRDVGDYPETRALLTVAASQIEQVYPHVDYVQDVRNLTAFAPPGGHNLGGSQSVMPFEREPSRRFAAAEWRPTQSFPQEEIEHAFGTRAELMGEHPVYGPGFAWELAGGPGEPTRIELFPDRRWASVAFVDGSLQRQERGLILDYLAVRTTESRPILSLVSAREGRGTLINVYPSGEVDEFFRLQPETSSLSPEALILDAQLAALPATPAPVEQPALTVIEAARQLGTGPENVRVLLRTRRLPGFKRGGAWYVPANALAELQASRGHRTE